LRGPAKGFGILDVDFVVQVNICNSSVVLEVMEKRFGPLRAACNVAVVSKKTKESQLSPQTMLISEAYELLQPIDHYRRGLRKARCLRIQNNSYRVGVHPGDDGKVLVDFIRSPIRPNVHMRGMRRKVVDHLEVHQLIPNSQRALGDRDSCKDHRCPKCPGDSEPLHELESNTSSAAR